MLDKIGTTLQDLAGNLGTLASLLFQLAASQAFWIIWIAVWLFAVDWKKLWPVLGRGGWVVIVLLGVVAAFVWSRIDTSDCEACGIPSFWWQLGEIGMLLAIALVCGHLQPIFRCAPAELDFNPPAAHDGHGHGHSHH